MSFTTSKRFFIQIGPVVRSLFNANNKQKNLYTLEIEIPTYVTWKVVALQLWQVTKLAVINKSKAISHIKLICLAFVCTWAVQ